MNKNYLACVISHGSFGCSLKNAVHKLVVPETDVCCFSNQDMSLEVIEERIRELMEARKPDKVFIFVDLVGGSCWLSANRLKKNRDDIFVIGGVNMPMLVSFHVNLNRLETKALVEKIILDGRKGILSR